MSTFTSGRSTETGALSDRDARARKAIQAFRALQPVLSAYATALSGRRVSVIMDAVSNGKTDGKNIYYRPPIALGDPTLHDSLKCDRRDRVSNLVLCPACAIRERVLVGIYHEIAHIAFDSFQPASDQDARKAITAALLQGGTAYAETVTRRLKKMAPEEKTSLLALSAAVSQYLPQLINALEDARIEARMFQERRGTQIMFEADNERLFTTGIETPDRENGGVKYISWKEQPLNAQMFCALYTQSCGYDFRNWFTEKVVRDVQDPILAELSRKVGSAESAADVYGLSFQVLERLKELGYAHEETDPEPPPSPEPSEGESDDGQPDTEQPESGEEGSSSEDGGSDSDDASPGDSPGESADAESPVPSSGSDAPDPGDEPGDGSVPGDDEEASDEPTDGGAPPEGDSSGGSSPAPEEDLAEAEASKEDPGSGDDPGEAGSDDSSDSDGDADGSGDSDAGPGPDSGDRTEGVDARSDAASDSTPGSGGEYPQEPPEGEGELEDAPEPSEGTDSRNTGSGDDAGESSPSDQPGDPSDRDPDGVDSDGSADDLATPSSDDEAGSDSDPSDRPDRDVLPEQADEDEITETDADEGYGGTKLLENESNDNLPWGDPDEVIETVTKVIHVPERPDYMEETSTDKASIDKAILQGMYFETPSQNIIGVREHRYANPLMEGRHNLSTAWDPKHSAMFSSRKRDAGRDLDLSPDEEVLAPALLKLRTVFADNKRATQERHLKSGKINGKVLGKRAPLGDPRLFRRKGIPGKRDYFVLLEWDISSSNLGSNIVLGKRSVFAQATLLHRLGVNFAILAHSGDYWQPTSGRSGGMALDVFWIKEPDQPWDDKTIEVLNQTGPSACNLDGHALEFGRKFLDTRTETDRVLLYYSDGKMPAENFEEELVILTREIMQCKRRSYTLLGVGIRTDSPARHGLPTVQVNEEADIRAVVEQLENRMEAR